ncbi:MAG: VTC domain-containing protein [Chloroflexi bacterium]|nr:VTC domain-containing protein [Anaerolineaceae bacterium]NMB87488.1 VTC domain-containing protein [Chloroflexota bacterium]
MNAEIEPRGLRYELKMDCEAIHLCVVRSWMQTNSAGFKRAYPPRQVNSLYFDTYDLDSYNRHIEGLYERYKLRLRWYGQELKTAAGGQFELKKKHGPVGDKLVLPLGYPVQLQGRSWQAVEGSFKAAVASEAAAPFRENLSLSRPLVLTTYWREYYLSGNGRVRLTLDTRLCAYDQWNTAGPNLRFPTPSLDSVIVEFKCEVPDARYLSDLLAEWPLRVHTHSKFIAAVDTAFER